MTKPLAWAKTENVIQKKRWDSDDTVHLTTLRVYITSDWSSH